MRIVSPSWKPVISAALTAAFVVSGCARGGDGDATSKPGIEKFDDGSDDPIYASEIAADEGEELLSPESLDRALEKFELAAKANPANPRAQFWLRYLHMQMELKGIVARVRPLFAQLDSGDYRYALFAERMMEGMTPDTRQFYLSGPADISSPELFQEWLDRFVLRLAEAREAFQQMKSGREFQIRAPRTFFGPVASSGSEKCAGRFGPIVYQPADCDAAYFDAYLNRADLEVLTATLATFQTELTVLNAWRLNSDVTARLVEHNTALDGRSLAKWINHDGAQLRSAQTMKASHESIRDFALSYQWLMHNQKNICPKGHESKRNRPGYLFAFGLCFITRTGEEADAARIVQILETVVNGGSITSQMANERRYEFDFDWVNFFESPLTSLSQLREVKVNKCDQVTSMNDSAMTPYFKKGSLNDFYQKNVECDSGNALTGSAP